MLIHPFVFLSSVKSDVMVSQASKFKDLGAETKMHFCKQHYRNVAIVVVVLTVIGLVIYLIAKA